MNSFLNFYYIIYGCSYGAKFKLLYSEKIVFYSEKHFHIQRKLYYIQRNIFIFRVIFLYLKFSIFREIAYLKKLFYIQRKFLYLQKLHLFREMFLYSKKMLILKKIGTFKENPKFKFQVIYHSRVSSWISTKKIEAIIKGQLT